MKNLRIETERLMITVFDKSMAEAVHVNSLDEDVRSFVPDEVFETLEKAEKALAWFMGSYGTRAPLVYPLLLKSGENIGYVQAVPLGAGWEIGYHVVKTHAGKGYATEAVKAFLPVIMAYLKISEIAGECLEENMASRAVLEKCGFRLRSKDIVGHWGEKRMMRRYSYRTSA